MDLKKTTIIRYTVINMNGYSIRGPAPDTAMVGIEIPYIDSVIINGPGSISNFQAGVLALSAKGIRLSSLTLDSNQIGIFITGSQNIEVQRNTMIKNSIGMATHTGTTVDVQENLITNNLLAGITSVATSNSDFARNTINGSQNGIFLDGLSSNNVVEQNHAQNSTFDI
jgi:parallel beta-helix repeat protein